MKRTLFLTCLLTLGLVLSQLVPNLFGVLPKEFEFVRYIMTMSLLAFIMIEVGREFEVNLRKKKEYAIDYGVAATAATFPWILVVGYFLLFLPPEGSAARSGWIDALLVGRFAAPTSAGVLFSMLAAAGLAGTWVFKKTRILAIFDDLDTVLLMIPLQVLVVGFAWQLGGVLLAMAALVVAGLHYYRRLVIPHSWPWIMGYSIVMVTISECLYALSKDPGSGVGLHLEVLLPAFVLGSMIKPKPLGEEFVVPGEDTPGKSAEEKAGLIVSMSFMFLVGLSMPAAFGDAAQIENTMSLRLLVWHVLAVTVLSNIGKMFVCFFYRKEASLRERLSVAIAMFPRGEVGAGVLAVSLSYGIEGDMVTVAFLSLALNLILTGAFIYFVKRLLVGGAVNERTVPERRAV